jgi:hypothetical protein
VYCLSQGSSLQTTTYRAEIYTAECACMQIVTSEKFMSILQLVSILWFFLNSEFVHVYLRLLRVESVLVHVLPPDAKC